MKSIKYFKTNEEFIGGGGSKLLKPTELEPNHVIYVEDTGNVLYDDDYVAPSVKFKITNIGLINEFDSKPCIIEKLQNGTLVAHTITGATIGDIITLSPATYGFALSSWEGKLSYYYTGGDSRQTYPHTIVDISEYDSSEVTDFSYMFAACDSITGLDNLDTSKGTNFNYMFWNAFDTNRTEQLRIKIPLDLRNMSVNDETKELNCFYMFEGLVYPTTLDKKGTVAIKGIRLDLSDAACPKYNFIYDDSTQRYYALINNQKYGINIFNDGKSSGQHFEIIINNENEDIKRLLYAAINNVAQDGNIQTDYRLFDSLYGKEINDVDMN